MSYVLRLDEKSLKTLKRIRLMDRLSEKYPNVKYLEIFDIVCRNPDLSDSEIEWKVRTVGRLKLNGSNGS